MNKSSKTVRLMNLFFLFKVSLTQIAIVAMQNSPLPVIVIILILNTTHLFLISKEIFLNRRNTDSKKSKSLGYLCFGHLI